LTFVQSPGKQPAHKRKIKVVALPKTRSELLEFLDKWEASCDDKSYLSASTQATPPGKMGHQTSENAFLKCYAKQHFSFLRGEEHKAQFSGMLEGQEQVTVELRASVIDWLFEVGSKLQIEDRSVLFQAIYLMDRYYSCLTGQIATKDL